MDSIDMRLQSLRAMYHGQNVAPSQESQIQQGQENFAQNAQRIQEVFQQRRNQMVNQGRQLTNEIGAIDFNAVADRQVNNLQNRLNQAHTTEKELQKELNDKKDQLDLLNSQKKELENRMSDLKEQAKCPLASINPYSKYIFEASNSINDSIAEGN